MKRLKKRIRKLEKTVVRLDRELFNLRTNHPAFRADVEEMTRLINPLGVKYEAPFPRIGEDLAFEKMVDWLDSPLKESTAAAEQAQPGWRQMKAETEARIDKAIKDLSPETLQRMEENNEKANKVFFDVNQAWLNGPLPDDPLIVKLGGELFKAERFGFDKEKKKETVKIKFPTADELRTQEEQTRLNAQAFLTKDDLEGVAPHVFVNGVDCGEVPASGGMHFAKEKEGE